MVFYLEIHTLKNKPFQLRAFDSQNLSCAHHYRINLQALQSQFIPLSDLLGQWAVVRLDKHYYSGFIESVVLKTRLNRGWHYQLTLASPWALLTQQRHYRSWSDVTLTTIVNELTAQYAAYPIQWRFEVTKKIPHYRSVIQYQQSNYQLLQRLFSQAAYSWFIKTNKQQTLITLTDRWPQTQVKQFSSKDDTSLLSAVSTLYKVSYHWSDKEVETLTAYTHDPNLQLGDYLHVMQTYYRVVAMHVQGQQGDCLTAHTGCGLKIKILLWPAECPVPLPQMKKSRYWSVFTGTLKEARWDPLQHKGLYRVRYHFDERGSESPPLARCEWGGERAADKKTCHWPLYPGNEVLLACVEGDWDAVVILGVLAPTTMPTPVTAENAQHSIARSLPYEWLWQDSPQASYQQLQCDQQRLRVSAKLNQEGVFLESDQGGIETEVEGTITHHCETQMTVECTQMARIQIGGDHQLTVETGDLIHQSAKDLSVYAKKMQCVAKKNIQCNASQQHWQAQRALQIHVRTQLVGQAKQRLHLESHAGIQLQASNLIFQVGQSRVEFNTHGLKLRSPKIRVQAKQVILQ